MSLVSPLFYQHHQKWELRETRLYMGISPVWSAPMALHFHSIPERPPPHKLLDPHD